MLAGHEVAKKHRSCELCEMRIKDCDAVLALWQLCDGLDGLETCDEFARFLDRNPGLASGDVMVQRFAGSGKGGRPSEVSTSSVNMQRRLQRSAGIYSGF